jgi:hypothetical protein
MRSSLRIALVLTLCLASDAAAHGSAGSTAGAPVRVLLAGFGNIVRPIAALFGASASPRLHVPLRLDRGWTVQAFELDDWATGLFLRVSGVVEFGRAEVTLADGEVRSLDLASIERADGDFELVDFHGARDIRNLKLTLRARERDADVAVLLGR